MSDDLETGRKTPPEPHEWGGIWRTLDRAEKSWMVTGWLHAVASNWKALCVVAAVALFFKGDDLVVFFAAWLGEP